MTLPYSRATSGGKALEEIRKVLTAFGCTRFGTMTDNAAGELLVQFTYRGRDVCAKASYRGYAVALLKESPWKNRGQAAAIKQAEIAVCSVLRDWIKGQVMAIETGVLTFEGAFLGQILLPSSGATVLEAVMQGGMLPQIEGPKRSGNGTD